MSLRGTPFNVIARVYPVLLRDQSRAFFERDFSRAFFERDLSRAFFERDLSRAFFEREAEFILANGFYTVLLPVPGFTPVFLWDLSRSFAVVTKYSLLIKGNSSSTSDEHKQNVFYP